MSTTTPRAASTMRTRVLCHVGLLRVGQPPLFQWCAVRVSRCPCEACCLPVGHVVTPCACRITYKDWSEVYEGMRKKAGYVYPAYILHEAGMWSDRNQQWVFLPRRMSKVKYDEVRGGPNAVGDAWSGDVFRWGGVYAWSWSADGQSHHCNTDTHSPARRGLNGQSVRSAPHGCSCSLCCRFPRL